MRLRILSRVWIPIVAASMLFQIGAANITALHANLSDSETSMGNLFEVGSIDVTVVSPRGGENWELGDDVVYVEWNTYPADQTYLIDIWASSDDGDHWQYKLAEDVPNKDQYTPGTDTTGSYRLLIPGQDILEPSDKYKLKVVAKQPQCIQGIGFTGWNMSQGNFTLS